MQAFQNDVPQNDLFKSRRKGNAKLQILVFDYVAFSFDFVAFWRFFHVFPLYLIYFAHFIPKSSSLQAPTIAYPLATGTTLSLTEILLRLAGEVARRAGGVSRPHVIPHGKQKMKNRTAIMAAPLRGSSPCKAGQFISTTFSSPAATDFRFFSSSPPHRSSPASKLSPRRSFRSRPVARSIDSTTSDTTPTTYSSGTKPQ